MALSNSLVKAVKEGKETFRYGVDGSKTAPIGHLQYLERPGYDDAVVGTGIVISVPKDYNQKNSNSKSYGIVNIKVTNMGSLNGYITSMMVYEKNKEMIEVGEKVEFQISSVMGKTNTGLPAFNVQHHLAGRVAILDESYDENYDAEVNAKINAEMERAEK